jgi:ribosomal protein L11 methyltransferase
MSSPPEPRYPFLVIDVPASLEDEASSMLFDLGASGVEVRDETTLARGAGAGRITLVGSFSDRESASEALAEIDPEFSPRIEEVVGDAWRDAWKEHFRPFALTPRIVVRPPWESYAGAGAQQIVLELEPGRAFGTGLHATTSLVARWLDARARELEGRRVLDVGTGSGILALVALALGASSVQAIDIDADAVEVARENAARNGFSERLRAATTPVQEIAESFPVVLANIEASVLLPMANALVPRVEPGGALVLSGLLRGQEGALADAYRPLVVEEQGAEGDWASLVLRRPPPPPAAQ